MGGMTKKKDEFSVTPGVNIWDWAGFLMSIILGSSPKIREGSRKDFATLVPKLSLGSNPSPLAQDDRSVGGVQLTGQ